MAATASPVSPYESSAVVPWSAPTTIAFWTISAFVTPGRAELAEAADATVSRGEVRIAAPAASVAPFWRGALRRASRWRMRRRRERCNDRSHKTAEPMSRCARGYGSSSDGRESTLGTPSSSLCASEVS
jgi:hypothetical protein